MDGLNVYLYVGNNPVNHVDPEGLEMAYADGQKAEIIRHLAELRKTPAGRAILAIAEKPGYVLKLKIVPRTGKPEDRPTERQGSYDGKPMTEIPFNSAQSEGNKDSWSRTLVHGLSHGIEAQEKGIDPAGLNTDVPEDAPDRGAHDMENRATRTDNIATAQHQLSQKGRETEAIETKTGYDDGPRGAWSVPHPYGNNPDLARLVEDHNARASAMVAAMARKAAEQQQKEAAKRANDKLKEWQKE